MSNDETYANQTAILKWLRDIGHRVEFVRDYVHDPRTGTRYRNPSVIATTPNRRREHPPQQLTEFMAAHVGKACPYCTTPMTDFGPSGVTRDHKWPRSKGGTLSKKNRIIACFTCNQDKGSMTLEVWHAVLVARLDPRARHVEWVVFSDMKGRVAVARPQV